jgi:hypothetical protein
VAHTLARFGAEFAPKRKTEGRQPAENRRVASVS